MQRIQFLLRGKPGWGVIFSLFILLLVEMWLHTDSFLYNYRSVFAAGRAMDKVKYVESMSPEIIIAGNSRVDNGFSPKVIIDELSSNEGIFNLGIPGANAKIMYGLFKRLDTKNLLGSKVRYVVFGLDESFFQAEDSLGYSVFYADRALLLQNKEFDNYFASILKLWGYSLNLKKLREPAKLERFIKASATSIEPWGGASRENLGFRANSGEFQNRDQAIRQDHMAKKPPDTLTKKYFWELLKLLQNANVKIAIMFPPLLNRNVLFLSDNAYAKPYQTILSELQNQNIPILSLSEKVLKRPDEFSNPGHLNLKGATRYSKNLAFELQKIWPELGTQHDI